jgi:hypothetical protein
MELLLVEAKVFLVKVVMLLVEVVVLLVEVVMILIEVMILMVEMVKGLFQKRNQILGVILSLEKKMRVLKKARVALRRDLLRNLRSQRRRKTEKLLTRN